MIYIVIYSDVRCARRQFEPGNGRVSLDPVAASLRSVCRVSGGFAAFWR
jgi:hypothetical protein